MIELQVLNYIISSGDASFVTSNNLTKEYFPELSREFTYIKNYIEKYGSTPSLATMLSVFNETSGTKFEVIASESGDTPEYLLDALLKNYRRNKMAANIQQVYSLMKEGEDDKAEKLYIQGVSDLTTDVSITCTDLFSDRSRYDDYVKRTEQINKYYLTTGFKELDDVMFGIDREEELGVIMARTNMGKSYITLKMAVAAAAQGLNVGFYSGEMTTNKVGNRMDSIISHIPCGALMHGNINVQSEYKKFLDGLQEKYSNARLNVFTPADVHGPIGVNTMRAYIEKFHFDILFIDQLSLMDDDRHGKTLPERQSNIIVDLKRLQTQTKIPIICVAQQNRSKNDDGSVDTTQIAGSDDIGKYATFVIAITRDAKNKNLLTLEVTKCRDGQAGSKIQYETDLSRGLFQYLPDKSAQPMQPQVAQPGSEQRSPDYNLPFDPANDTSDDVF